MIARLLVALVVVLSVCACAAVPVAPAGPYAVGDQRVTLGRTWSDVSGLVPDPAKTVRLLSIDGPYLNRLYITGGLRPGQGLVRPGRPERPRPVFRSGMTATEQVEFLADTVAALGYQRVETDGLRPATLGEVGGLRIDIRARTTEGLDIAGLAQAVDVGGRLYVILYLAPAEHYFAAHRREVEAVMASARPGA